MDMDQSDDSPKRPCYRCDYCRASFGNYTTLAAHFKTSCPSSFHQPSHSTAVVSQAVTYPPEIFQHSTADAINQQATKSLQSLKHPSLSSASPEVNRTEDDQHPPQAAREVNQPLTNRLRSATEVPQVLERTHLCVANLKSAAARKESSFAAFAASCVEVQKLAQKYSAVAKRKDLDLKAYNYALGRKNALCTISSEYEQLILNDVLSKALAKVRTAFKNEETLAMSLRQAIDNQKKTNEDAAIATAQEQSAFNEAIKTFREEVTTQTAASQAVCDELAKVENVLQPSLRHLINLQEKARLLQDSIFSVMQAASKIGHINECSRQDGANTAAAISDIPQEWISTTESFQIQQMMDLERAELEERNEPTSSGTQSPAGPSDKN